MEVKLGLALFFIFSLCRASNLISIEKVATKSSSGSEEFIGAMVSYGQTNKHLAPLSNENQRTGHFCLKNGSRYKVGFVVASSESLRPVLRYRLNFDSYDTVDSVESYPDLDENHEACFLYGSWWPSNSKLQKVVQIFINLVEGVRSIGFREVIHLRSVSKGGILKSSLYFSKDDGDGKDSLKKPDAIQPGVAKADFEKLKSNEDMDEGIDEDVKASLKHKKETSELISEFDEKGQIIVGSINCDYDEKYEIKIYFGYPPVEIDGEGELLMSFNSFKITKKQQEISVKEFAELGPGKLYQTFWAMMQCVDHGMEFKSKFNFRTKEEAQEFDEEEEAKDDATAFEII